MIDISSSFIPRSKFFPWVTGGGGDTCQYGQDASTASCANADSASMEGLPPVHAARKAALFCLRSRSFTWQERDRRYPAAMMGNSTPAHSACTRCSTAS